MTTKKQNQALEGKSVEHIAKEQGKSTMDAFLDLSLDEELQTCSSCVDRGYRSGGAAGRSSARHIP